MKASTRNFPPEIQNWISAQEPDFLSNWCALDYSKATVARLAISFGIYELEQIQRLWVMLEVARKEFFQLEKFEKAHLGAKEIARRLARIRKNPGSFPVLYDARLPAHPSALELAFFSEPETNRRISEMQENLRSLISERNIEWLIAPEFNVQSDDAEEPPYADDRRRYDPISSALIYFHERTAIDALNKDFRMKHEDLFREKTIDGTSSFTMPSLTCPRYQKFLCDLVEAHLRPLAFRRKKNIKRYAWTAHVVNFWCDGLGHTYTRNKERDGIPSEMEDFVERCLTLKPLDEWKSVRNLIHRHDREYWRAFSVDRLSGTEMISEGASK